MSDEKAILLSKQLEEGGVSLSDNHVAFQGKK